MNKRKFRFYDNNILNINLQKVIQIKEKIEELCLTRQVSPEELELSMIPTDILYNISACYEAMYSKLLDEELIKAGFPTNTKLSKPTYH